jgi:hypothetical protein
VAIVAHYVPACAPEGGGPEQLELIALGDFDRSNDSVSIVTSDAALQTLSLPSETRAAELSTLSDRSYWGAGELDTHNQIPILLWPQNQACPLAALGESDAAGDGSWLLGISSRSSRVLVLGTSGDGRVTARALGLADAQVEELASDRLAPLPLHASISELGSGLLVAGGENPQTGLPQANGWVLRFDPSLSLETRALASARSRHAALSLPSGASMLVGGQSPRGEPLASVEIVAPDGRASQVIDLLEAPRVEPRAVLLGGGRILVGGGYTWSDAGAGVRVRQPVASVEFSSTDLAEVSEAPVPLEPAALDRAFVQLAGGAALAVGGCEPAAQSSDCIPCESASGCVSRAAWWIDPRGAAHELEPLPLALAAARPALVPAAEGAPWLLADGALGRFDPWRARFDVVAVATPMPSGSLLGQPRALGPGAFVWLTKAGSSVDLVGLYHSQRGRFTQDVAPLLVGSGRGVLPLRPPSAEAAGETTLAYAAATGLELAGSAAVASIADTDYADFTLELTLRAGPPPLLRLVGMGESDDGSGTSFGGLECPWPESALSAALPARLGVHRSGDEVRLQLEPATSAQQVAPNGAACRRALPERVSIQLVGTRAGATELSRIEIRRSVD